MPRKSSTKPQRKNKKAVSFEKRVMAVVHKKAETKQKVVPLFSNTNLSGVGLAPGSGTGPTITGLQIVNLGTSLSIAQGVEQEQRQGNVINNCKLRCRGLIETLPYDATSNPSTYGYEVHMLVFKKRDDNQNSVSFLKSQPNNIVGSVDGTLINTMYPYNKDAYIIKRVKVFRMQPQLPGSAAGTSALAQPNTYLFKRFYVDIPVSKTWKYQDASLTPNNEWTSIAFYVVNSDGSTYTGVQSRCQITMDATLRYDDF